jgi:hypothetical protein
MASFNQTLEAFVLLLKERNVEKELNVVIKNPSEFTVEYILEIVNKISEGREAGC